MWVGNILQAASDEPRLPTRWRGSGAAPFLSLRLSSPRSRHRPLSSTTNSNLGRELALTHVLLEGVGGEQRHLTDARALVAAVWLRMGGCSGFGDPRPRLPRRLGSDSVLALPPPHLPDSCLTGQLRVRAPPARSAGDSPPRARSHQPQAFSQRPCSWGGGGSTGPRPPMGQATAAATFLSLGPRQDTERGPSGPEVVAPRTGRPQNPGNRTGDSTEGLWFSGISAWCCQFTRPSSCSFNWFLRCRLVLRGGRGSATVVTSQFCCPGYRWNLRPEVALRMCRGFRSYLGRLWCCSLLGALTPQK